MCNLLQGDVWQGLVTVLVVTAGSCVCVCVCVCVCLVVLWYPSADTEAQVEFGFKWILNTSAYLEERSF